MKNKKTTEQFIKEAKEVHNEKYDYSAVDYQGGKVKVSIICNTHGMFEQLSANHLKGHGCSKCATSKSKKTQPCTLENFIKKVEKIHNKKYDYSKTNYINSRTKVIIICPIHGEFTKTPSAHINNHGCTTCRKNESILDKKRLFIKNAKIKHGDTFDYSDIDYKNTRTKINFTCKKHGLFLQSPKSHLITKISCPNCESEIQSNSRTYTKEIFIEKAVSKHNNSYNYDKVIYEKSTKEVTISCTIHGDFTQTPKNHLEGKGCTKCGYNSHWSRDKYIKKAKGRICTFYKLKCFNENEEFYKIGITMNTISDRYRNSKEMPYNYEIILEVFGEAGEIWDMERKEIKKLKDFHYTPEIKFGGSTQECFTKYFTNEE